MNPAQILQNAAQVVGGLALFLFGLHLAGNGLRTAIANHLRTGLRWLTRNRLLAVTAGTAGTFFLSSSSAATALLVGLVEANLISATQTYGVILGTGIGTAVTVQVIALKLGLYAGIFVGIGFLIREISRYTRAKAVGNATMGFGLLFLGLTMMGGGMQNLLDIETGRRFIAGLLAQPMLILLVAAGFTAIIQTSAATIVFAFSVAASVVAPGGMAAGDPVAAFVLVWPIILGANIGTSATALLASLGASRAGWHVSIANLLFKILAVTALFWLGPLFAHASLAIAPGASAAMTANVQTPPAAALTPEASGQIAGAAARIVANGHLLFNIAAALIFIPLLTPFGWVMNLLLRIAPRRGGQILTHLKPKLLKDDPAAALNAAFGQTVEMARRTSSLISDARTALRKDNSRELDDVQRADDSLDLFYELLTDYLSRLPTDQLDGDDAALRNRLLLVTAELERIGDLVSKSLVVLARKKIEAGIRFDDESAKAMDKFVRQTRAGLVSAVGFLADEKGAGPNDAMRFEADADKRKNELHLGYLRGGHAKNRGGEAAAIYIEMVSTWREIHSAVAQILRILIGGRHARRLGE